MSDYNAKEWVGADNWLVQALTQAHAERDALSHRLARAEERIARYAEKCAEIEHEYHTTDWLPDQCVTAAFENRILEVGMMASDDAPTDGAARAGGCPSGGTAGDGGGAG